MYVIRSSGGITFAYVAGVNLGLPFQPERTCSPEQNQALGLNTCASPVGPAGGDAPFVEVCRACEAQYSCVLEATVRTPVTGRDYSFDDYANAFVTTIQMYTLAGWGGIMQDMMDADNPIQASNRTRTSTIDPTPNTLNHKPDTPHPTSSIRGRSWW
jgi:hypothetical protein